MKKNKYTKFFGWLAVATMLLTTSCKDDLFTGSDTLSDEVTVSFTLTPEAASTVATRAVNYPDEDKDKNYPNISDGSKADVLIYAVYDNEGNLLLNYGNGVDEELEDKFEEGDGQTIMKVDKFPVTIRLTLKRGQEYTVAFWAQSSKTKGYNTSDLKKVEVIYSEIEKGNTSSSEAVQDVADTDGEKDITETPHQSTTPNNDEYRDAFCRSVKFTAGAEGGLEQNVLLYRPLAQINVGTSGFDFEAITRNAVKKYTYSKIRLNRVARYLDVVEDKTYSSTTTDKEDEMYSMDNDHKTPEAFAVVDFEYAPIPAYVNFEDKHGKIQVPEFPSYTIWDEKYEQSMDDTAFSYPTGYNYAYYEPEEFLKVNLYRDMRNEDGDLVENIGDEYTKDMDDDGFLDYANMYANDAYRAQKGTTGDLKSETFKYLSMCYVLTSSTKTENITINNVKVWLATDAQGTDEVEVVNLNNVPARRNWRTNIIGNLLTEEETFQITLDRDFAGEYNGWAKDNEKWEYLSGPIAKGVYYDAKNDEIQISDADGLLWLQKMVNGKLIVRQANKNVAKDNPNCKEAYYSYYSITSTAKNEIVHTLEEDGISDPTIGHEDDESAKALKERILTATHQNLDKKHPGWPKNNNFHFMAVKEDGTISKATVRLMNNIDLSAISDKEGWIPIGFDVAVCDGSPKEYFDVSTDFWYSNGNKQTDATAVRAFCGNFKGGNHTISNIRTKRYAAKIHPNSVQDSNNGPYDNPQWFPTGFFGVLGGDAHVEDLRLFNVDFYGYHTGGGIAGIACGGNINIQNCVVDGGSVELYPLFRGDGFKNAYTADSPNYGKDDRSSDGADSAERDNARTFARGIYTGGIVGYYNAEGNISNNEVRNLTLRAYRNIGGVVGSMASNYTSTPPTGVKLKEAKVDSVKNNNVNNVLIIADKFQPYDFCFNTVSTAGVFKTGFGWQAGQLALSGMYVGGYEGTTTKYDTGNSSTGVRLSEFSTQTTSVVNGRERIADIDDVPLKELPLLSSWFSDTITLRANFYGTPSAKRLYETYDVTTPRIRQNITENNVTTTAYVKSYKNAEFTYPFSLPYSFSIDYKENSGNVGLYVESVKLTGAAIGGRSVITPENVTGENSCAIYVTARNRKQMWEAIDDENGKNGLSYRVPTIIKDIVLRGSPYAWAGVLIAPNINMDSVVLNNVAIYDVYQTIALDNENAKWPAANDPEKIDLKVRNCNLRGYTIPGSGWQSITFYHTTFEQGAYINRIYNSSNFEQAYTYKADADATFKNCYFKAPYVIDFGGKNLTFTNNGTAGTDCFATAQSNKNVKIMNPTDRPTGVETSAKVSKIRITSDVLGNPIVIYYYGGNTGYGHDGKKFTGKTYDVDGN